MTETTTRISREEWLAKYPNHCKACEGAAAHYGVRWGEETADPCGCAEDGRCPRCGKQTLDEDGNGPCEACGWTGEGAEDVCPSIEIDENYPSEEEMAAAYDYFNGPEEG